MKEENEKLEEEANTVIVHISSIGNNDVIDPLVFSFVWQEGITLNDVIYHGEKPGAYTVIFDLNGGTLEGHEGSWSINYPKGETIVLPKPLKNGYRFAYWQGSKYDAGDPYTVNEDHTFKAIWEKIEEEKYVLPKTGIE